jgi:predicted nuclease of predicted toxin-antitoxin system
MKFYADENFALRTVIELRDIGHDVLTAFEDGKANQGIPDDEVLARATEINRVILTHNRIDFRRLPMQNNKHSGIVICTENKDRIELARSITEKVSEYQDTEGELIRVYRPSI